VFTSIYNMDKNKFTPEQIQCYRSHFEMYDLNRDGVISAKELKQVSLKLGYRLDDRQIRDIMMSRDLDANGCISFDEFLLAMPANSLISDEEHKSAEIRRKFQEYDRDGNGSVTLREAHDVLRKELAFGQEQSAELLKRYDKNGDGQLSYEEFVRFYTKVKSKANQIKAMFREFDKDNSGAISVSEAKLMLRQLNIPDEEITTLVAIYDTNKDGELQYDEFVNFLLHS